MMKIGCLTIDQIIMNFNLCFCLQANYYKSKFEAPKKHSASKEQKLSQGVQAFLTKKKEEEEKKKVEDAKKMQASLCTLYNT
jgi:hypothetical protein